MDRKLSLWALVVIISMSAGSLFGGFFSQRGEALSGAVYGLCCGVAVIMFEQNIIFPSVRSRILELPWLVGVILLELIYILLIFLGAVAAGLILWTSGIGTQSLSEEIVISPTAIAFALFVSGIVIVLIRMRALIGPEIFNTILVGRYHHPVEEERIFLFVDMIGSTAYAQMNGDRQSQAFLAAIFASFAEPVRQHRGSLDDYIGDMAMITWPMNLGIKDARCISCAFAILNHVEASADSWIRNFGQVPEFHMSLHGGSIVTAEIGVDRRKISYFGDVVNTTGRIEALCKSLGEPFLISSELLERIGPLPDGVIARSLGDFALKGRGDKLAVSSVRGADIKNSHGGLLSPP